MKEFENYLTYLELSSSAENTIITYSTHLKSFIKFFDIKNAQDIDVLMKSDYRNFVTHLLDGGRKASTVNGYLRSLSAFILWLLSEEVIENETFRTLRFGKSKFLKEEKKVDKYIPTDVMDAVQDACRGTDERLMFALLRYSGMRSGEIAGIRLEDIQEYVALNEDGEEEIKHRIHLPRTKGGKSRYIPIPDDFVRELNEYVVGRKHKSEHLFVGKTTHKAMSTCGVYKRLKRIAGRVITDEAVLKQLHPHAYRHTAAKHWLTSGLSPEKVGSALGHGKGSTQVTMRYAGILAEQNMDVFASQSLKV